jgi:uncharacterized Zn-finger protein
MADTTPDTIEVHYVDGNSAACDDGGGGLGHPRVFLAIDRTGRVSCPYCGRVYVRDPAKAGTVETLTGDTAAAMAESSPAA